MYTPGVFEAIFLKKDYLDVQNEADQNYIEHNIGKAPNNDINIKNKGGKPSIVSKFPQIVDTVAEFFKQHGFAAQSGRNETAYSSWVTIAQIQELYIQNFLR